MPVDLLVGQERPEPLRDLAHVLVRHRDRVRIRRLRKECDAGDVVCFKNRTPVHVDRLSPFRPGVAIPAACKAQTDDRDQQHKQGHFVILHRDPVLPSIGRSDFRKSFSPLCSSMRPPHFCPKMHMLSCLSSNASGVHFIIVQPAGVRIIYQQGIVFSRA